jgi:hypothetical protein
MTMGRYQHRTFPVIARRVCAEAIQSALVAKPIWIASRSLSSGGAFAPTRWLAMTNEEVSTPKSPRHSGARVSANPESPAALLLGRAPQREIPDRRSLRSQ